jgi:hypothetical protein
VTDGHAPSRRSTPPSRGQWGRHATATVTPAPRRPAPWSGIAVVVFVTVIAFYGWLWLIEGAQVGAALLLVPLLIVLSLPVLVRAGRHEPGFELAGLLTTGLLLRFLGAYPRFENAADSILHQNAGVKLASSFREFDFSMHVDRVPGTGGFRIVTGVVNVFTNDNAFATFLVLSWLAFWGCFLCYRALVIAFPASGRRRYALLVMLWPSLLFWPSSIGKEAWVLFAIGISAYGAARAFTRRPGGYLVLILGLAAVLLVRPHVALLLFVAFAAAFLVGRRDSAQPGKLTPGSVAKIAGLLILVVVGSFLASRTEEFLGVEDISSTSSIQESQEEVRTSTEQGGSEFDSPDPFSPTGYPQAAVSVLFRPFPWEASGSEQLGTAAEAMFLVFLAAASWRRLLAVPRLLRSRPYVTFALVFVIVFVFAFGVVSNFGLLARQRAQVLPFVFVLLSVPPLAVQADARAARAAAPPSEPHRPA